MFDGPAVNTWGILGTKVWEILNANIWEVSVIFTVIFVILGLFLSMVIFFISSTFWCWCWKINKRVWLMEEQIVLLKKLLVSNENLSNAVQFLISKEINKDDDEKNKDNNKINILL